LYNGGKPLQLAEKYKFAPDQLVVKFSGEKPEKNTAAWEKKSFSKRYSPQIEEVVIHKYNTEILDVKPCRHSEYYLVDTRKGCDIEALRERLLRDPLIEDASPNYLATITSIPNDPSFAYQYALDNTGQVYLPQLGLSGTSGSDIKAPGGWTWTTGSEEITIAILDTGVESAHEDLKSKIVPGYNFVDDNYNTKDDNGHGTFVASIAAAETDNNTGMAGVCRLAKIMPVKCVHSSGAGSYLAIATAIRYAADSGAQVINLSLGGAASSFILEDACKYAFDKGCVIAASAGNYSSPVLYPAAYDDYCLAVAATDADDHIATWSNFGPQVDVAAPGVSVFGALYLLDEPDIFNSYGWASGTSFSTPYVAGAAALLMAYKPFLSNSAVMKLIKYTADDVNETIHPGVDDYMGYGRINLKTLLGPYDLN
jgi:subtilisin family serine protease